LVVSLTLPGRPLGEEVEISGLGVVRNGESVDVGEDKQLIFQAFHGRSLLEAFEHDATVTVTEKKVEKELPKPKARARADTSEQVKEVKE
jgi:hypothetical protein